MRLHSNYQHHCNWPGICRTRFNGLLPVLLLLSLLLSCNRVSEEFYPNGNKKHSMQYKGRKLHGHVIYYHENGSKSMEFLYQHNQLEGVARRWDYNGVLLSAENYHRDMKEGLSAFYNEHGKKIREETYSRDTLHGPYAEFYVTGFPAVLGVYRKGQFHGIWKYFDPHGKQVGVGEFTDGDGVLRGWYPDRTMLREVQYRQSLKEGKEIHFNPDGSVREVKCYHQGVLVAGRDSC